LKRHLETERPHRRRRRRRSRRRRRRRKRRRRRRRRRRRKRKRKRRRGDRKTPGMALAHSTPHTVHDIHKFRLENALRFETSNYAPKIVVLEN
jgi:sRNA-binding protein